MISKVCMSVMTTEFVCLRPYHVECTGSHLNTEVKQRRASLVPGWVTAWESLVLQASFFCQFFNSPAPHF